MRAIPAIPATEQLLSGKELLEAVFTAKSRPSLRWLREQQRRRTIPFRKIGRLCFFDADEVRRHLAKNFKVEARQ